MAGSPIFSVNFTKSKDSSKSRPSYVDLKKSSDLYRSQVQCLVYAGLRRRNRVLWHFELFSAQSTAGQSRPWPVTGHIATAKLLFFRSAHWLIDSWLMTHDSWLMTHDSWLIDSFDSLILHTRFLLKQQQNCHAQIQQDFLANSSPTEFLCLPISSNILHFWQSFALFNNWLTLAQKDLLWFFRSLGCIATLKASSACFTAFPLSNVIVSELNLRQAQNKSSNICSCSSLKCWKGINKNAIFTWWRHRKD